MGSIGPDDASAIAEQARAHGQRLLSELLADEQDLRAHAERTTASGAARNSPTHTLIDAAPLSAAIDAVRRFLAHLETDDGAHDAPDDRPPSGGQKAHS